MVSPKSGLRVLVVVESPTKARTIRRFLPKDFVVESCMGHVRDLPQSAKDIPEQFKKQPWSHLGVNVDQDFQPIYCVPKNKTKVIKELKSQIKEADELILATDEDREGESISWHLLEVLKPKIPVKRMVFHEITKEAIEASLRATRELDLNLVRAQEARRVLDRLVGYTLSPLLWKKVAYGLSAGRVQSVAVRLISAREHDRLRFKKSQYWSLSAENKKSGSAFESKLQLYKGQKVAVGKDFDGLTGEIQKSKKGEVLHLQEKQAKELLIELRNEKWVVSDVVEKPISRKPSPPFITSTLQQEANRKLGLSSRETMQVAQKLYEQGLITYMRTDSTFLSQQAIDAARKSIQALYGKNYLPKEPRTYSKKKVKGAQEAHEAIRPAGADFVHPEETKLKGTFLSLYDLIWKRTMASQMLNSEHKQMTVKLDVGEARFSASGMTIEFPGFLKAYVEGRDDPEAALDNREVHLPALKKGEEVSCENLLANTHETKPPARYTEATLIQTMEKEGIGRPSTYASIIGTIQDRGYVKKSGSALAPTFTALVVSQLLENHLPNYVDVGFTSEMEKQLDEIASGDMDFVRYLQSVYFGDEGLKEQVSRKEETIDPEESRGIALEGFKGLSFRVGRYGAYVCRVEKDTGEEVCASLPETHFPGDVTASVAHKLIDQKVNGTDALGKDPETGKSVYVLTGRYGPYVQLGEAEGQDAEQKPKRTSVPPTMIPEELTLEQALKLLELPKTLGEHPETGKVIKKGLGRFGPYVVHDGDFRSIPKGESLFEIGLERALEMLAQPKKRRGRAAALKELGEHPETGDAVSVFDGKYGPYLKCGKVNVSLPDDLAPKEVSLEKAVELLADRLKAAVKKGKKKTQKKSKTGTVSKKVARKVASEKQSSVPKKKVVKIRRKKKA